MAADFTPGPWSVSPHDETGGYDCMTGAYHVRAGRKLITSVDQSDYGQPPCEPFHSAEAEANARLIAAAPTGYQLVREALQALTVDEDADLETWVDLKDWIKAAREYLRAVEGEP